MDNSSRRPAMPGVGKAPGLKMVVVGSVVGSSLVLALLAWIYVGRILVTLEPGGQSADDAKPWLDTQQRQLRRSGLHKLDQRGKRIWKDIDALQEQIDAYQRQFNALKVNEVGRRLIKDDWAVRYFVDKWGEPLPPPTVAEECRVRLNELMLTVKEALAKTEPRLERAAYEISAETQEEVESIEFEVRNAKKEYTRHRLALDGLVKMVTEGRPMTEQTLGEVADGVREQQALRTMGHRSAQKRQLPGESSGTPATKRNSEPVENESSSGEQSRLYDEVQDSQSDRK